MVIHSAIEEQRIWYDENLECIFYQNIHISTRATEMIGWTVLCLPTVMIATFCLSLKARCFLAFAFVAKMAINSPQNSSHGGTVVSKRNRTNISLTKTRTTQISRLKNGIGLTMKLGEHDCCAIVVTGGLIVWAHISEVTITRAVISKKKMNIISNNLAVLLSCKSLSVKRGSLFWWSPSPSTVLAKRMMTTVYKVFSTTIPWNTNFNWNQPKPMETNQNQLIPIEKNGTNWNELKPIETNWAPWTPAQTASHGPSAGTPWAVQKKDRLRIFFTP